MQQANQKKDTIDGEDEGILLLFLGCITFKWILLTLLFSCDAQISWSL